MANGGGYFGDRNRDGIDDDFDGAPGSDGDTASYDRIYDPLGQEEFSNLPEPANYIEAQRLIQAAESYNRRLGEDEELGDAQSRVHLFPSVGKFIVPKENTWAAHSKMVKDPNYALGFDPERFVYFDKIVAEEFGNPALYDYHHPDYQKYEGLRTNLAVMRNDIIGMYLDDGSFDPGDEKYIPKFEGIARALGQSLANDTWMKRPLTEHMSVDVANVEGVGAREMYTHLLDMQSTPSSTRSVLSKIPFLQIPDRTWDLESIEHTPYSDENLAAPLPEEKIVFTADELATYMEQHRVKEPDRVAVFSELSLDNAASLNALDRLDKPVRDESIEEARTILRWLKNLEFGEMDVEEWLDQGTPDEKLAKAESIARLTEIFALQTAQAGKENPDILQTHSVQDAGGAAGALAIGLAGHGLHGLPADHAAVIHLAEMAKHAPENWPLFENSSVNVLLDTLDEGLEYTSKRALDPEVAAQRLLDISNQMERKARQLRSVDSLEPPTREESVELAREILRRLRNMKFSDQTAEEAIDFGRPEEKAAFARNLASLADTYSNMVKEAAETNPDILSDPQIKEANDAMGSLSHAIKLMAAKEMPNSLAATQQISADITQMPKEWKHLHEHTIERLLASMEGGLSKAVEEIELQMQEAQDQDEELAQQMVESSMHHDHLHRKRKKRKKQSVGGLTKAAKRRTAMDLNGDGIADHLQGLDIRGDGSTLARLSAASASANPINRRNANDLNGDGVPDHEQGLDIRGDDQQHERMAAAEAQAAAMRRKNDDNNDGIADHLQGLGKIDSQKVASQKTALKTAQRHNAGDLNGDGIPDHVQKAAGKLDMHKLTSQKTAQKTALRHQSGDLNGDGVPDHLQKLDMSTIRKLGGDLRKISDEAAGLKTASTDKGHDGTISPDDRGFSLRDREQRPNNRQRQ